MQGGVLRGRQLLRKGSVIPVGRGSLKCLGLLGTDTSKSVLLIGPWKQIVVSDLSMSHVLEGRGGCVRQSGASQKFAPGTSFWEHIICYFSPSCGN